MRYILLFSLLFLLSIINPWYSLASSWLKALDPFHLFLLPIFQLPSGDEQFNLNVYKSIGHIKPEHYKKLKSLISTLYLLLHVTLLALFIWLVLMTSWIVRGFVYTFFRILLYVFIQIFVLWSFTLVFLESISPDFRQNLLNCFPLLLINCCSIREVN